ncbi:hypothetical protein EV421DRAFT_1720930 [Armillaria borealis]|uniref:Uncharacterized protein n=1 Tax=Armillaria borealis TaxID=47425 RepID=A0AA39IWG0_9AGAR|nr:hypothetical protein EV421DRAFT_1720930 [Armillaria borealis]
MAIRDIITRWNYTHAMIERALILRKAIDNWVFATDELKPLLLTSAQWNMLEKLGSILGVRLYSYSRNDGKEVSDL